MSTIPWPDRPMACRSFRVAMTGIVHDDDPEIIADMQRKIERLQSALVAIRDMKPDTTGGIVRGPQPLLDNCQRIARDALDVTL